MSFVYDEVFTLTSLTLFPYWTKTLIYKDNIKELTVSWKHIYYETFGYPSLDRLFISRVYPSHVYA